MGAELSRLDRPRILMIIGLSLAVLLVGGALAFKIFQPIQVLPRIRLSPGFALLDQEGKTFTNEDLRGQFVLYNFMYTHCSTETCEAMNSVMREIQEQTRTLDTGGVPVKLVSISVDPQRDTPEALRAYAEQAGADAQVWRFATAADPKLLKTIVGGGFETYYQQRADGSFELAPVMVLVDGWGIIRGEYRYSTSSPDAERILRHIGVLAKEVQNSTGASRLAYEAAHLFLCYSP